MLFYVPSCSAEIDFYVLYVPDTPMLYMTDIMDYLLTPVNLTLFATDSKQNIKVNNKSIPELFYRKLPNVCILKCNLYCKVTFCLKEENAISEGLILTTSTSWEIARPNFTCTVPFRSSTGLTHFW